MKDVSSKNVGVKNAANPLYKRVSLKRQKLFQGDDAVVTGLQGIREAGEGGTCG